MSEGADERIQEEDGEVSMLMTFLTYKQMYKIK